MDNKPKVIFPDGLTWKDPSEKAPSFIKGQIHVHAKKLVTWLQANKNLISERGYVVLDLKESMKGGLYFSVNTWKPQPKQERNTMEMYEPTPEELKQNSPLGNDYPVEGDDGVINPSDIPF